MILPVQHCSEITGLTTTLLQQNLYVYLFFPAQDIRAWAFETQVDYTQYFESEKIRSCFNTSY